MNEAERFFYDHGGWSYDPVNETPEQGRIRCAKVLARAEERLKNGPYFITWDDDPEPWDGDTPYDGPLWIVSLWKVPIDSSQATVLGAVGSVATTLADPYTRVIEAELALEHIQD